MIAQHIYEGADGRPGGRRSALGEALETWWISPTEHAWRMLLPALYDVIARTAVSWGRKHGLNEGTRLTPEDLAQTSFSRFMEEFQQGAEPDPAPDVSGRATRPLTRQSLADMRLTYTSEQVVSYLKRRSMNQFKSQFDRLKKRDKRVTSMMQTGDDGELHQMEIEDRSAPDPWDRASPRVVTAAEDREADRHIEIIWVSAPKKKQIQAYLLQQALRHAEVMAELGVPESVFRHLNACEKMENKRTIRVGMRNEMAGSSDAIQSTILGRFLNLGRSTALEQVKAFDRYLINRVKPACDAGGLEFSAVVGCLLRKAVSRLVSERVPFWGDEALSPGPDLEEEE
ncbi:MAG TPA: hypothetical protein PLP29_04760 [Candidatus Ozemobacteraceae bacterium]|nr:hypothetical protein [Candidatus Ozemobacteraceae bacterium]